MASAKYKRGKDGYFQARVWDGSYTENGEKRRRTLRTKKSSAALEKMVNAFQNDVSDRKYIKQVDFTFLEYSRRWMQIYKAQRSNNTKAMYQNIIEKHFCVLGDVRLRDIDRIHLQILLNNAAGKIRTQQQIQMVFKQVLKSAVSDQLFPANVMENIFQNIDRIRYTSKEKRPLTTAEKQAVFSADLNDQDKAFLYILYGCGLRRGEALALTPSDFNFQTHEVHINKAHEFTHYEAQKKDLKCMNGVRTLPIPDKIYPYIKYWVEQCAAEKKSYLFTMRDGLPLSKSSYDKMWKRILKQLQAVSDQEITGLTAHVFRHNYCTNLCYQIPTVSIKRIAQLLGDSEKMVIDVYNHVVLEKEDASSAVNNAINF